MAGFMDRIKKLFRRKTKQSRPEQEPEQKPEPSKEDSTPKTDVQPATKLQDAEPALVQQDHSPAHEQQDPRQAPLTTTDGAADTQRAFQGPTPATRSGVLQIALVNQTTSSNVFAYITGSAIDRGGQLFVLGADARTGIYPPSPSATGTKIAQDYSIRLGPPGNTVNAVIPRLAGGRIWFSVGAPLVFAVFNPADPNSKTNFGFAEFTFNAAQVFANISYVDFISLPIALALRSTDSPNVQRVAGLAPNGLETIAEGLRAQTQKDGRRWSSLIVPGQDNRPLRILSPNSGKLLNPTWFQNYYAPYVDRVWDSYRFKQLTVDTQASWGEVDGQVRVDGLLDFGSAGTFAKPSTADIFSCSTGPFATGGNAERNAVIPRLAAAFNRSTLLLSQETPNGTGFRDYYKADITNHFARIVHEANIDKHGYAFPYDDVTPDGGIPQEGAVFSFSPQTLTVTVGGR